MSDRSQTMLEYLRAKNPSISRNRCPKGKNTASKKDFYLLFGMIEEWEDFEYDSLQSMYGDTLRDILNHRFKNLHDFSKNIASYPYREIWDEDSLEAFLVKWNESTLCEALFATNKRLGDGYGKVVMVKGSQAKPPRNKDKGCFSQTGQELFDQKWSSDKIILGTLSTEDKEANWLSPLRQVYTYCIYCDARYGFIITDKELVVLRCRLNPAPMARSTTSPPKSQQHQAVSRHDPDRQAESYKKSSAQSVQQPDSVSQRIPKAKAVAFAEEPIRRPQRSSDVTPAKRVMEKGGTIEYKAIPWANGSGKTRGDPKLLTVNLALWYLCLMAAENSHIEDEYPPLRNLVWETNNASSMGSRHDPGWKHEPDHSDLEFDYSLPASPGHDRPAARSSTRSGLRDFTSTDGQTPKPSAIYAPQNSEDELNSTSNLKPKAPARRQLTQVTDGHPASDDGLTTKLSPSDRESSPSDRESSPSDIASHASSADIGIDVQSPKPLTIRTTTATTGDVTSTDGLTLTSSTRHAAEAATNAATSTGDPVLTPSSRKRYLADLDDEDEEEIPEPKRRQTGQRGQRGQRGRRLRGQRGQRGRRGFSGRTS